MKKKHQRLLFISFALVSAMTAILFFLRNIEAYMVYFYAPSELLAQPPASSEYIRVGGLVKEGSVSYPYENQVQFIITDYQQELAIRYNGILPALFREGQGIVAEGHYQDGQVVAKTILAKHDEYYMPPEVAKTLKKQGHWKAGE